jgi:hypothetical protein
MLLHLEVLLTAMYRDEEDHFHVYLPNTGLNDFLGGQALTTYDPTTRQGQIYELTKSFDYYSFVYEKRLYRS